MHVESGEGNCISIAVTLDKCLDEAIASTTIGALQILPVWLTVERKSGHATHSGSGVLSRWLAAADSNHPPTAATSLEPAPRTLPELSNWERCSVLVVRG